VSEARPGGEAEEIRPRRYVVDSKTETIDRRWGAGVGSVGRSFRQEASSHIPEWVKISVAWVVGYQFASAFYIASDGLGWL